MKNAIIRTALVCFAVMTAALGAYSFPRVMRHESTGANPISMSAFVSASSWTEPDDGAPEPSYTESKRLVDPYGNDIYYNVETGIVCSGKSGKVKYVMRAQQDGELVTFDQSTDKFLTSADQMMTYYYDSTQLSAELVIDGKKLIGIPDSDNVYMVSVKRPEWSSPKTVYAVRRLTKTSILSRFIGSQAKYKEEFYDMDGRFIDPKWFVEHTSVAWWKRAQRVWLQYGVGLWIYGFLVGFEPQTWVTVRETGTYGNLREFLNEIEVESKFPQIPNILTENEKAIYFDPRTNQCTDKLYHPLFDRATGMPVVYLNGQIKTFNQNKELVNCTVDNGFLVNVVTEDYLRDQGKLTYVSRIHTPQGDFEMIVLHNGTEWTLTNGESAKGIAIDAELGGVDSPYATLGSTIKTGFNKVKEKVADFFSGANGIDIVRPVMTAIRIAILVIAGLIITAIVLVGVKVARAIKGAK